MTLNIAEALDYEDRETFYQTLTAAIPKLTEMQMRCLILSLLGLTQVQAALILGVTQPVVSAHFSGALAEIENAAGEFR